MSLTTSQKIFANFKLEEWANNLRSNKFIQGRTGLEITEYYYGANEKYDKKEVRYCCLGVLAKTSTPFLLLNDGELYWEFYPKTVDYLRDDIIHPELWTEFFFFPRYLTSLDKEEEFASKLKEEYPHLYTNVQNNWYVQSVQTILYSINDKECGSFEKIAEYVELLKYNV